MGELGTQLNVWYRTLNIHINSPRELFMGMAVRQKKHVSFLATPCWEKQT